jgi:transcriptional regulator with XRE-family HTH domain
VKTDHTIIGDSGLVSALKQARENKGLSQRALSAKIDVPQSPISKIESGRVDIKASSLIELARALDLEIMLIPRSLVPAVESLTRTSGEREKPGEPQRAQPGETDIVHRAHRLLETLQKNASRIARTYGAPSEIERLHEAARALDRMRLTPGSAEQVLQVLKSVDLGSKASKKAPGAQLAMSDLPKDADVRDALQEASRTADKLRHIRNALAHGANETPTRPLPAYRLSDGDDDA